MTDEPKRGLSSWLTDTGSPRVRIDPMDTVRTSVGGEFNPPPAGQSCVTERFDDLGEIGRGGMNVVRRVFDKYLLRDTALKVLDPAIGHSDYRARRFLEEARVTGQLEHPNIVPVHELGTDDEGVLYFSMKLVQGDTLGQQIAASGERRLEPDVLAHFLQVLVKVCEAVSFAHSKGVVHRDLKPANIMVGEFGQVYLMDWGIARIADEDSTEGVTLHRAETTPPPDDAPVDTIVGTPRYMAPEQAEGRHDLIDAQTDVFALGGTLYHVLTGRPPHNATSYYMVLVQATKADIPPPDSVTPTGVPAGLSRIAMKALAREKSERYASVVEMQHDLEAFLRGAWHLPIRRFHAGHRIITQGDEGDEAYIVVSGVCAVVRYLDGTRRVVRELGPGEVFGELAILTEKPRSAHVDATTEVELMVVTRQTLSEAIGLDSWVGRFVRALAERFRELDARVEKRELRLHREATGSINLNELVLGDDERS